MAYFKEVHPEPCRNDPHAYVIPESAGKEDHEE
jgi:hypothetical protein